MKTPIITLLAIVFGLGCNPDKGLIKTVETDAQGNTTRTTIRVIG